MLAEKLGITEAELRRKVPITVMTRGEAGSVITVGDEVHEIPAAQCRQVVDPTGAGDAFRSGFVLGYKLKLPWPVVGRLASLTAVYAVEQHGPQQHAYTVQEFIARYRENFGSSVEVDQLAGHRASTS
jgi:adenosine kinase